MRYAETTPVSDIQAGLYPLLESPIELLKEKSFFPRDMTRREFLKILLVLLPLVFVLPTALYYVLETIFVNEFWSYDLSRDDYRELIAKAQIPKYGILPDFEENADFTTRWDEANTLRQEVGELMIASVFSVLQDMYKPERREELRSHITEIDSQNTEIMINLGLAPSPDGRHPFDPAFETQTKFLIDEYLDFLATIPTKNKKYLRIFFEFNIRGDIAYGMEQPGISQELHEQQFKELFQYCAFSREKHAGLDIDMVWCVSANNTNFMNHYPENAVDCIGVDIYDVRPNEMNDVKYWGRSTRRQNFRKNIEQFDARIEELRRRSPNPIRKIVTEFGSLTKDAGAIEQILVTFFSLGWDTAMYFNYDKSNHHSAIPVFQLGPLKIYNRYEINWKLVSEIIERMAKIKRDIRMRKTRS